MSENTAIEITIVVTFYKNLESIQQVIDSIKIFSQNYKKCFEIILVNDSGDESIILYPFQDELRITTINLKKNVGVTEARNIGYNKANGKYILFYDSDDFLISNSLLLIDNFINNNLADIFLFRCIDENGELVGEKELKILYSNTPNLFYGKGERILCIRKGFKKPFIGFLRGNEHSGLLRLAHRNKPILFCSSNFPVRLYTNNPKGLSSKIDTPKRIILMSIGHCINSFYCILLGDFYFAFRFFFSAIYRFSRLSYTIFKPSSIINGGIKLW